MSHAGLVKLYIEGKYPNGIEGYQPMPQEEIDANKLKAKEFKKEQKRKVPKKTSESIQSKSLFE